MSLVLTFREDVLEVLDVVLDPPTLQQTSVREGGHNIYRWPHECERSLVTNDRSASVPTQSPAEFLPHSIVAPEESMNMLGHKGEELLHLPQIEDLADEVVTHTLVERDRKAASPRTGFQNRL